MYSKCFYRSGLLRCGQTFCVTLSFFSQCSNRSEEEQCRRASCPIANCGIVGILRLDKHLRQVHKMAVSKMPAN